MKKAVSILLPVLFLLVLHPQVYSQVAFKISEESTMTVTGTSTIHDWTSKVNEIYGDIILTSDAADKKNIKPGEFASAVKIEVPVLSIESPRGPVMDTKTYNALKSEEFPNIIFELKNSTVKNITDKATKEFVVNATGDLTIAGFTKNISLDMQCKKLDNDHFSCKGSYLINMTDYKVVPPTAMFGQIKTGEEVTIDFELILFPK